MNLYDVLAVILSTMSWRFAAMEKELLQSINTIRHLVRIANNKTAIFFPTAEKAHTIAIQRHNEFMRPKCEQIKDYCEKAIKELDRILA